MTNNRLVAQIPARGGSKRVPRKNVRNMAGRPMIAYSIEAALAVEEIDDVVVNTDDEEIAQVAGESGALVHMRPKELASDSATGDDFTLEFIQRWKPKTLMLINPVCPLVQTKEIQDAIAKFNYSEGDTLISCSETQMQVAVEGTFVNIDSSGPLMPSQENPKVQILNWAVAIWDTDSFLTRKRQNGPAYLGEQRILFPIDGISGIKVSEEEDFLLAEAILQARKK